MSSSDPNAGTVAASAAVSSSSSANPHISATSLSLLDHPHHQHHHHRHPHVHPPSLPPPTPAGGSSNPSSSNSPSSSSLPASLPREYRKGNWTIHETLVLITAKRLDDERRSSRVSGGGINIGSPVGGRSAELRWKWVENYCWRNGCLRSQNQCNDKWDNLLRDYKKVRDYEARCAAAVSNAGGSAATPVLSYWAMEKHDRKERNLPSNLAAEVYHALTDVLSRRNANKASATSLGAAAASPVPVLALPPQSVSSRSGPPPALLLTTPHLSNHLAEVPPPVLTTPAAASTPSPSLAAASSPSRTPLTGSTPSPVLLIGYTPSPAPSAVSTPPATLPAPAAPPPPQQPDASSVPGDTSAAESTPPDETSSSSSSPPPSPEDMNSTGADKQQPAGYDPNAGTVVVVMESDAKPPPSESPNLPRHRRTKRSRSRSLRSDDEEDDDDNIGGMERGASVLASALLACEERREKRHREMLELEERRALAEEARGEASRQGMAGLIAAVNNLAGAIHALVADHHGQYRTPPPAR